MVFLEHQATVFTTGSKTMIKTAVTLARTKAVSNCPSSHCILYHCALTLKGKERRKPDALTNVLDKTVKITNFIEFQPVSKCLFTIL